MGLLLIDPKKDKRWDAFVESHKHGSVYHTSSWCGILEKTFNYKPVYLILEEDNFIKAGLPMMQIDSRLTGDRIVSLPRTPYCDPLIESGENAHIFWQWVEQMVKGGKTKFFEFKTQKNTNVFDLSKFVQYDYFLNHTLNLDRDLESIWKSLHTTSVKQRIKKSKGVVEVVEGENEEDLIEFYRLLKKTSKKHKIPKKPLSWFVNIWSELKPKGNVILLLAKINQQNAAGSLSFIYKDRLSHEFMGYDYTMMKYNAGHALLWREIQKARAFGVKVFDWGLSPPGNQGLIDFKRRWGTDEKKLTYFYYPDVIGYKKFVKETNNEDHDRHNRMEKVTQALKRFIAEKLYKHIG